MDITMDVSYIAVESHKLNEVPKANGQIIALMDKDALFYYMEGQLRSVSGQKIVDKLPTDTKSIYKDTLFIITQGENRGVHAWTGDEFIKVAGVNTDENVASANVSSGVSYVTGSSELGNAVGTLQKDKRVYIDHSTGKLHAAGFAGTADSATKADSATRSDSAITDENNQNISRTYIKAIEPEGTEITVTYGDNSTKKFNTQDTDTHSVTNVVVTNGPAVQENRVGTNGNVYLNVSDDTSLRSSHLIKGSGSVQVTSDAQGNINISGTNTWQPNTSREPGYVSAGEPNKVWGTDGDGNPSWIEPPSQYEHPDSVVVPGTYTQVQVNQQGHVVAGVNPTTLQGYNIQDAVVVNSLPHDADLDSYRASGVYFAADGNSIEQKPEGVDGFILEVATDPSQLNGVQKMYSQGNQFIRYFKNGLVLFFAPQPMGQGTGSLGSDENGWIENQLTDTVYVHPTIPGFNHIPRGGEPGQILRWSADGTAIWSDPTQIAVSPMTGSTLDDDGDAGLVPAPPAGPAEMFLRNDGSWSIPPNTTYSPMTGATSQLDGTSGLVPAPAKSETLMFLGSDGRWHTPEVPQPKPEWQEYIPEY